VKGEDVYRRMYLKIGSSIYEIINKNSKISIFHMTIFDNPGKQLLRNSKSFAVILEQVHFKIESIKHRLIICPVT
jgi:hypothetical protein